MISLTSFIVSYLALIFIARLGVEIYTIYDDKKACESQQRHTSTRTTSNAVQRYYSMKNARNHTNRKGA